MNTIEKKQRQDRLKKLTALRDLIDLSEYSSMRPKEPRQVCLARSGPRGYLSYDSAQRRRPPIAVDVELDECFWTVQISFREKKGGDLAALRQLLERLEVQFEEDKNRFVLLTWIRFAAEPGYVRPAVEEVLRKLDGKMLDEASVRG